MVDHWVYGVFEGKALKQPLLKTLMAAVAGMLSS